MLFRSTRTMQRAEAAALGPISPERIHMVTICYDGDEVAGAAYRDRDRAARWLCRYAAEMLGDLIGSYGDRAGGMYHDATIAALGDGLGLLHALPADDQDPLPGTWLDDACAALLFVDDSYAVYMIEAPLDQEQSA